ncbi:MAG: protein-L-isoaspartate(D-aspartate) O-methyltransferase [Spirochaetia bacterium]|jgi:protein-L-isoaspartate(D-aspartate) O-methyltransferase
MVRLQLENRDIIDQRVLDAMRRVPRHHFVSSVSRAAAYEDHPLPIGYGQTISQPYMVAFMTQALLLRGSERVLEIGTGSGYQAAVLAECAAEVFSVERIPELSAAAEKTLASLGYRSVHLLTADGSLGWPEHAPFDRIIVAAAAPAVPPVLCDQLADNGIMVVPVGDWRRAQEIVVVRRTGGHVSLERSIGCRFVPLVGKGGFEGMAEPSAPGRT